MAENIKENQTRSENVDEEENLPPVDDISKFESCNLTDSAINVQTTQDVPDVQSIHTLKTMTLAMAGKN